MQDITAKNKKPKKQPKQPGQPDKGGLVEDHEFTCDDRIEMFEAGLDRLAQCYAFGATNIDGGVVVSIDGLSRFDVDSTTWRLVPPGETAEAELGRKTDDGLDCNYCIGIFEVGVTEVAKCYRVEVYDADGTGTGVNVAIAGVTRVDAPDGTWHLGAIAPAQ